MAQLVAAGLAARHCSLRQLQRLAIRAMGVASQTPRALSSVACAGNSSSAATAPGSRPDVAALLRVAPTSLASQPLLGLGTVHKHGRFAAAPQRCRVYNNPEVYDIAFNFREIEKESAHLLAMYQKHCEGPMGHFLEVACGPAQHATAVAKATGATATALDVSSAMLRYAQQLAEEADVGDSVRFVQADMCAAGWAELVEEPADLSAVLLGSLAHCLDNGAALACFQELGAVRPGGLLVLELPPLADLWGGCCLHEEQYIEAWDAQSADGSKTVLVEWGREGDTFDLQAQVLYRTVGMSVYVGDDLAGSEVEVVPQRQFTLQEVDLLGRAAGFQLVEAHGDFDGGIGLEHEEAFRTVACLKRL